MSDEEVTVDVPDGHRFQLLWGHTVSVPEAAWNGDSACPDTGLHDAAAHTGNPGLQEGWRERGRKGERGEGEASGCTPE